VRGTGLRRCSPDVRERDSGEARRSRGGAGAATGAGMGAGDGSGHGVVRVDAAVGAGRRLDKVATVGVTLAVVGARCSSDLSRKMTRTLDLQRGIHE
jgi:hypothetical protein